MMTAATMMTAPMMAGAAMTFRESGRWDEQASGDRRYEGEFT
jgi:hypothetical protein